MWRVVGAGVLALWIGHCDSSIRVRAEAADDAAIPSDSSIPTKENGDAVPAQGRSKGQRQGLEATFKNRDKDGDGRLTFEEFLGDRKPSELEKPALKERFEKLDADGNDGLSIAEFTNRSQARAGKLDLQRTTDAESAFRRKDNDGNGRVTFEEFLGVRAKENGAHDNIRYRFNQWDLDDSEDLDFQEFRSRTKAAKTNADGRTIPGPTFKFIDRNGDKRLSYEEFVGKKPEGLPRDNADRDFQWRDVDRSGFLSLEEFELSSRADPDPNAVIAAIDLDNDGDVSLKEFIGSLQGKAADRTREMFHLYDQDGNHVLTSSEFRILPIVWATDQIQFEVRDENKDGRLDLDEFVRFSLSETRETDRGNFAVYDADADGFLTLAEYKMKAETPLGGSYLEPPRQQLDDATAGATDGGTDWFMTAIVVIDAIVVAWIVYWVLCRRKRTQTVAMPATNGTQNFESDD